jgi:hypothetical protein
MPPAGGIEPGSPQGAKCQVPRAAEATSGATARPLDLPLSTADYRRKPGIPPQKKGIRACA